MANFKKLAQLLVVSGAVVFIAACSTTGDGASVDNGTGMGGAGAGGAQTSGAGDNSGFANSDGRFGGADSLDPHYMQVGDQKYYFDFDRSDVHPKYLPSIQVQADYLNQHNNAKVLLEGYTDPRGSREYNVALGQRRADAVAAALKADGVNPSQLRTVSYGAEKLASTDHTEEGYALDRRVHLVYVEK